MTTVMERSATKNTEELAPELVSEIDGVLVTSLGEAYERLAHERRARAQRMRRRAAELGSTLTPLADAARRRASELELSATALDEIASAYRPAA